MEFSNTWKIMILKKPPLNRMKKIKIILFFVFFTLSNVTCQKNTSSNDDDIISYTTAIQYPADVTVKVKGRVSCYKEPNKQCLVLQDGYLWKGYPFKIDNFSYQSGEYTLLVRAEEVTGPTEDYLTYKLIKTIDHKENIEDKANCNMLHDQGSCEAAMPRAFFNSQTKKCEQFFYGGCNGSVPFDSVEECRLYCEK